VLDAIPWVISPNIMIERMRIVGVLAWGLKFDFFI
jgi:hypothetical protein